MTKSEHRVADYLTKHNIKWDYERPVFIFDEGERSRTWYPDFYLSDIGLYLEVCGADRGNEYNRREKIYRKNKIPIVFVHTYKQSEKWQYFLKQSIIKFVKKRNNTLLEIDIFKQERIQTINHDLEDIRKEIDKIHIEFREQKKIIIK